MDYRRKLITSFASSYQHFVKPVFFQLSPEFVHERIIETGELFGRIGFVRTGLGRILKHPSPLLRQCLSGISFENPIGLSAGFDYDARLTQILPSLGFGFGTVGTITNMPYKGNPSPMLGRLPKSNSLMVNKGFKNRGAFSIAGKLDDCVFDIPIGISIGRTNVSYLDTVEASIRDILDAFEVFEKSVVHHSYYELNISCPNLGLASGLFYSPLHLKLLLDELDMLRLKHPIFIKMPIEKEDSVVLSLLECIVQHKVSGVIFGNLQKNRNDSSFYQDEVKKFPRGNFSGKPTYFRSNELIRLSYRVFGKELLIVGCGGVFSAETAYEKILLGASLVELITGMIFQGPQLIEEINSGLVTLLKRDGFLSISEAVGKK